MSATKRFLRWSFNWGSPYDWVLMVVVLVLYARYSATEPAPLTASIARSIALYSRPPLPSQWDREIVAMLALRGCAQLAAELCGEHAGCYSQKLENCLWH
jgi:hypothetical protein